MGAMVFERLLLFELDTAAASAQAGGGQADDTDEHGTDRDPADSQIPYQRME